jgi:UDP-N-acetylglucosamine 2-epimerase (non-hydrolysing)
MTTFTHIVGARPNFMKAGTVISACQDLGLTTTLIHTGQHYDKAMSEIFFNQLELPRPDVNLEVGSGTHGAQTAALLIAIEAAFEEQRPSHVVVYGDINSTLAAAIVCSKMMIPVSHVEAGLRSFDRSMPEEVNRVITDALSSLHFVTSLEAVGHLSREGIAREGVHFVGNPMIDTLLRFQDLLKPEEQRKRYGLPASYGVVTLHRPSNVDDPVTALRIVEGLRRAAKLLSIVVPLHPRGRQMLTRAGLYDVANLQVVDPMGYLDFMSLMAGSSVVLTDSGGIQEETTILRIPCLTLRENTERPVTVSMGTNRLVGNDPDLIERAVAEALAAPRSSEVPPKWDGRAGLRIGEVLASL